jgi:hypothetical protein
MPFDVSAFKLLIKKMFPPNKCVSTLDTTGNGKPDSIKIQVINVIVPFVVPAKIEIEDFNFQNIDKNNIDPFQFGNIFLDNELISLTKENLKLDVLQEKIQIFHGNELFTLEDIIENKFSGRTIALGDTISVIIKLDENSLKKFNEGAHIFKIESDFITGLEINFELDEDNMNLSFKPNNA